MYRLGRGRVRVTPTNVSRNMSRTYGQGPLDWHISILFQQQTETRLKQVYYTGRKEECIGNHWPLGRSGQPHPTD